MYRSRNICLETSAHLFSEPFYIPLFQESLLPCSGMCFSTAGTEDTAVHPSCVIPECDLAKAPKHSTLCPLFLDQALIRQPNPSLAGTLPLKELVLITPTTACRPTSLVFLPIIRYLALETFFFLNVQTTPGNADILICGQDPQGSRV